jgi:hypothetical protein
MSNEEILERLAQLETLVEEQKETIERQRDRIDELETTEESSPRVVLDGGDIKVIGEISADGATGVQGKATGSGTTKGVEGRVSSSSGYGLYTPDDANVDGTVESSTDFSALVDGDEVVHIEPFANSGNVVFGSPNEVTDGATSATIAGGGASAAPNKVHDNYGFVGGGIDNQVGTPDDDDPATAGHGTISGGQDNRVEAAYATVGGGNTNKATNTAATVPGGVRNTAGGQYSFAAGRRAKADFSGNFVWADSTNSDFRSSAADQFLVQAGGGAGIGTNSPSTQLDVDGAVTASDGYRGNVGSAAYLGTNQTVPGDTTETIQFDGTDADQRSEFDTSTGEFVCKFAGDYAVDVGINMSGGNNAIQGGDEVHVNIAVNSLPRAETVYIAPQGVVDPTITVSRTVFGLTAGDTITAELDNTTSGDLDVYGGASKWTWMTVRQVA